MKKDILEYLINLLKDNELAEIEYKTLFSSIRLVNYKKPITISDEPLSAEKEEIQKTNLTPEKDTQDEQTQIENKSETQNKEEKIPENIFVVKAPIMGTFYRAPSPDAKPYVREGDKIETGDVLCIIEAMKVMNEVESEVSGTIDKILVKNGESIEANQPLFYIKI